jgi:hypothetical protein
MNSLRVVILSAAKNLVDANISEILRCAQNDALVKNYFVPAVQSVTGAVTLTRSSRFFQLARR